MASVSERILLVFLLDILKKYKHTTDPEITMTALKTCFYKSLPYRAFLTISHLPSISLAPLKPMFKMFQNRQAVLCISGVQLNVFLEECLPTYIVHFCASCEEPPVLTVYFKI